MTKSLEFRDKIVALFEEAKVSGVIIIAEHPQYHFSNVNMGPGQAIDTIDIIRKSLVKKTLESGKSKSSETYI